MANDNVGDALYLDRTRYANDFPQRQCDDNTCMTLTSEKYISYGQVILNWKCLGFLPRDITAATFALSTLPGKTVLRSCRQKKLRVVRLSNLDFSSAFGICFTWKSIVTLTIDSVTVTLTFCRHSLITCPTGKSFADLCVELCLE